VRSSDTTGAITQGGQMNAQQRKAQAFQTLTQERDEARARADQLLEACKAVRPTLVASISEGTQDWRKETRQMLLAQLDAAIATPKEKRT
jgi:uncharacterized protein YdhG (YjbR/CyaY superfamily)